MGSTGPRWDAGGRESNASGGWRGLKIRLEDQFGCVTNDDVYFGPQN